MNRDFLIEQLEEFKAYLVDVYVNGLDGYQLDLVNKLLYKTCITYINFLVQFLKRK